MNRTLLSLALVAASGLAFAHDPASPGRDIDKVNGGITATENLADLAGLELAWSAISTTQGASASKACHRVPLTM